MLKKARLVWLKQLQGVWQITRLEQRFLSFTFYKTQRYYEKIMCIYFLFRWFSGENCIIFTFSLHHSHKKWNDSLEGSLDRVLLAAELEFLKILVPRLPQHTSNVNIECAGKSEWSKQQCSLHVTSFLEHWYILILLFWY